MEDILDISSLDADRMPGLAASRAIRDAAGTLQGVVGVDNALENNTVKAQDDSTKAFHYSTVQMKRRLQAAFSCSVWFFW
jgi:hypothetical protein